MADDSLSEMPFLRNLGFVITYRCQVACPHCIVCAGPDRTEAMTDADLDRYVDEAASYRDRYVKVLALTGGEPFIDLPRLRRTCARAARHGLLVSVVTNAHWAASRDAALHVLCSVPGIHMMAVSTDLYHQRGIPLARVVHAVDAARELLIPFNVVVCTENESDPSYLEMRRRLEEVVEPDHIMTAITFPVGRAAERLGTGRYERVHTPPQAACSAGSSPMVFPDGRVEACIGPVIDLPGPHPLRLGNLHDEPLAGILDRAQDNVVLHTIRIWGPRKLIELAVQAGLSDALPSNYIKDSVCCACLALMGNPRLRGFLTTLAGDPAFREKVAYARVHYLHEREMADRLGLGARATA